MKVLTTLALAVGLASAAAVEPRAPPQIVHLTFHGGPAEYSMTFPADGQKRNTSQSKIPFPPVPVQSLTTQS